MSSRLWRKASIAVVCTAALLAASACTGSGGGSASGRVKASLGESRPDHHENADAVCQVVTAADASKLFAAPAVQNATSSLAATGGACIWNATKGSARYTLIANIYDTPSALDAPKAARAASVPGIGDRAYASSVGSSAYAIWLQKGRRVARLKLSLAPARRGAALPTAATLRAPMLQLARTVAGRM